MKEINISKNITDLRKKKGITQEQLAVALNISPQAVSKWETNTSQPDTQTLPLIAEYFETSIDYLFYGEEYAYNDIYNNEDEPNFSGGEGAGCGCLLLVIIAVLISSMF